MDELGFTEHDRYFVRKDTKLFIEFPSTLSDNVIFFVKLAVFLSYHKPPILSK